jgi:hypothetical protein
LPPLLEFCGLPSAFKPEALAPDNTTDSPTVEWTPENKRRFEALAAPMMRALGYPLR